MQGCAALVWLALIALLWAVWGHKVREWPSQRKEFRRAQAAARQALARQHANTGMRLMQEKNWPEAIDAFDRALDLLETDQGEAGYESEPRLEASLLFYRGFALEQTGQLEEAVADYEDCQAIYGRLHEEPQYVAAVRQGFLLTRLGRGQEAEQHLRQTLSALQRAPPSLSWLQAETFSILAAYLLHERQPARALEYAEEGLRTAHHLRDAAMQASFLHATGEALRALGRPEDALHGYEQSLDLYRRMGETGKQASVRRDMMSLYQLGGQWDKALAWLQACLVDEEREQNKQAQAQICYDMACIHIDLGNLQDAGKLLQHSISLFRQAEDHEGIDRVGRTMMGFSILVHRHITADQMTFRDVERGSKSNKDES